MFEQSSGLFFIHIFCCCYFPFTFFCVLNRMWIEARSMHGFIEIGLCYTRRSTCRKKFGRTEFSVEFKRELLDESACSKVMVCYCCSWIRLYFVDIFSTIGMQSRRTEKLCLVAVLGVDNLSDDIHDIMSEMFNLFLQSKQVMRKSSAECGKLIAITTHLNFSSPIAIAKRHSYEKKATMK